jgi:hypothetical protein
MYIVKTIEQYDENNIFFCEPIKNNIINEGNFIRILYSNDKFTLNGIFLLITLTDVFCEKYHNKYRCIFNIKNHKPLIDKIKYIEEELIKKTDIKNKIPQYKIYDQLKNGNIKIFNDIGNLVKCSFILKISGIWETANNYGLTFKFSKTN